MVAVKMMAPTTDDPVITSYDRRMASELNHMKTTVLLGLGHQARLCLELARVRRNGGEALKPERKLQPCSLDEWRLMVQSEDYCTNNL